VDSQRAGAHQAGAGTYTDNSQVPRPIFTTILVVPCEYMLLALSLPQRELLLYKRFPPPFDATPFCQCALVVYIRLKCAHFGSRLFWYRYLHSHINGEYYSRPTTKSSDSVYSKSLV
jgi:hypothetical protein